MRLGVFIAIFATFVALSSSMQPHKKIAADMRVNSYMYRTYVLTLY